MNNANSASKLLQQHKLRKTLARVEILELYAGTPHAMSHGDVERQLSAMDRVTIYRTLATFENKGIIHRAHDGGGVVKYALCSSGCSTHNHHDEHLHFSCVKCGNTYCIEGYTVPQVKTPKGYTMDEVFLFAKGTCEICNS